MKPIKKMNLIKFKYKNKTLTTQMNKTLDHTEASQIKEATSVGLIDFRHVSQTSNLNFFPMISSKGFSSLRLSSIIVLSSLHNLVWYRKYNCLF